MKNLKCFNFLVFVDYKTKLMNEYVKSHAFQSKHIGFFIIMHYCYFCFTILEVSDYILEKLIKSHLTSILYKFGYFLHEIHLHVM